MDPFSLIVGAVGLAEAANKLANSLTDRYRAFTSAPKEMLEIAGQVTMCAGLVDVFARSLGEKDTVFPKRFQQDAFALITQCRTILNDIEEAIPHGSKKPDYADRLRYAFGTQKRIVKHQENLKQVQHMFMFMTTCWQYQLSSNQPVVTGSKAPTGSVGTMGSMGPQTSSISMQGTMQHIPVQMTMKDPSNTTQTVAYEATLTLKPIQQYQAPFPADVEPRITKQSISRSCTESEREKQTLSNMRRSPYFSMDLLKPKGRMFYSIDPSSPTEREKVELRLRMERERTEHAQKKEREETEIRITPPSTEQASREVDHILSQWFQEDSDPGEATYDSFSDLEEAGTDQVPLTKGGLDVDIPLRPSSAPIPKQPAWDWRCDGCDRGYFYHDTRFNCRDCYDYDLCPNCFRTVWHRHDRPSFVERNI